MELINMKKFFLLLFITLTWAGLSRASIGETIQQSLDRYGKPVFVDRELRQIGWDDGEQSYVATFDPAGRCDMLQIFKDADAHFSYPPSFDEDELIGCLIVNFPGTVPPTERPVAHGRAWLTKDPQGPAAYYDIMVSPLNGHKLFCLQIGTSAGYNHLGDIYLHLIQQNLAPKTFY
jgi:hypothetical protein